MKNLRKEIERVINGTSSENGSDTPDFILADYLANCLAAFDRATTWRDEWYSPEGVPEGLRTAEERTAAENYEHSNNDMNIPE